ncbi:Uncharacterised protein [Escherichia coli]|nr:Uncharacterised protein [Escherichia coli]
MALCFQYVDDLHHAFADVLINNACLAKQVESGFHIRCLSFNNSVPVPHSLPVVDGEQGVFIYNGTQQLLHWVIIDSRQDHGFGGL